jgi:hypothetical protein
MLATEERRALAARTDATLLEQHHNDLSNLFGTVNVVTVVLGKGGRWMEMGIVDALPLGEL